MRFKKLSKKSLAVISIIFFFMMILGPLPVAYYYVRNKVLAHHGIVSPDDSIAVNWFRWWGFPAFRNHHWEWHQKSLELGIYFANPGGAIHLPPNYQEALSANLTLKANTALICDGPCQIDQNGANQILVPQGANDVSVISYFPNGIINAGLVNNANSGFVGYTGTAEAFHVGTTAGITQNFHLRGFYISLENAGVGASCLKLTQVQYYMMEYPGCQFGAVSGQRGFITEGGAGASFVGLGTWIFPNVQSDPGSTNEIAMQFGLTNISNADTIVGGHITLHGSGATNPAICIDKANGDSLMIYGMSAESCNTVITVESTSNAAVWGFLRGDSSITNFANFGAGTQGNHLWSTSAATVIDTGTSNSVEVPNAYQINSRFFTMTQTATAMFWNDVSSATSRIVFAPGSGGATRINGGSGAAQVIFNQDSGTGGALAAWSLNKLGQADIVSSSGAINTGETIIVKTPALVANRLVAGTHFRITLAGTCTSTVANVSTFTLRWGTLGTTSDGTVAAIATSVAATSGTNNGFRAVIDLTVRIAGASATSSSFLQLTSDGNIGIVATPNDKSVAGTAFNTTTASGILSLAYKSAATTTTSTFTIASIEIVDN
jgi:hypothetical protein